MFDKFDKKVILLHPNIGAVATPLPDLMLRLNNYGKSIRDFSADDAQKLILIAGISNENLSLIDKAKLDALRIIRLGNSSPFPFWYSIRLVIFLIRNFSGETRFTLLSGDLRSSLIPLLACKKIFRSRVSSQISIHGDFTSKNSGFGLIKFLISEFVIYSMNNSNSIRVVSDHLAQEVLMNTSCAESKIFISPIPISKNLVESVVSRKLNRTIAIVGRLHSERGVEEALYLCTRILTTYPDYKLIIIGGGNQESLVRHWVEKNDILHRTELVGELTQEQLLKHWPRIDVLVSNAPSEGYGMSIREAVLSGCWVLARKNPGTLELLKEYKVGISLYSSTKEFFDIFAQIKDSKVENDVLSQLRQTQLQLEKEYMLRLMESWLIN